MANGDDGIERPVHEILTEASATSLGIKRMTDSPKLLLDMDSGYSQ